MFIETDSKYGTGFEISEFKGRIILVADLGENRDAAIRTLRAAIEFIKAGKIEVRE